MFPSLTQMPPNTETRWFSAENWLGEKGKAAQTKNGRKGSPSFPLPAGEQNASHNIMAAVAASDDFG